MENVEVRGRKGTLHFIRFPTSEMGNFLELAKSKGMATLVTTVCATGGGAFKFEEAFLRVCLILFFSFWMIIDCFWSQHTVSFCLYALGSQHEIDEI